VLGFPGGPWQFRDRFGEEWSITLVSAGESKPVPQATWEHIQAIEHLVFQAFSSGGAVDDELAGVLLRVYDALTSRTLSRELLPHPSRDRRRRLRNFAMELRQTLRFALAADVVRVEKVVPTRWPFLDWPFPEDSTRALGPEPASLAPDTGTFVGLQLVNQNGDPVPNRPYRVVLPDLSVNDGMTDSTGSAVLRGVSPGGLCRISCPFFQPHPSLTHQVQPGEHISGIAYAYGFEDYTLVWDDPNNATLASQRSNAHELVPGDQVYIPELPDNATTRPTGAVHTFVVQQSPLDLRIKLLDLGLSPLASLACTLDGADLTTDGSGVLSSAVLKTAQASFLSAEGVDLALEVGRLAPPDDDSDGGWKARLYNLGFLLDPEADDGDDELCIALQDFQAQYGLPVTGTLDDATKAQIGQQYGC
jgi:hypothetical protein